MIKISTAEKIIFVFLLFVAAMLLMRIAYANNFRYIFLMWNLFLAWVPFQISLVISSAKKPNRWMKYFLLAAWLLFFPNALYIITDLLHLGNGDNKVPLWFDVILLFTSSIASLVMAFVSLYNVELFLRNNLKAKHINKLIVGCLFLGSFGVYLGRFLRWNSWDIVANPVSLLFEVAIRFSNPLVHYRTWAVTLLLTCLFSLLYYAAKQLPVLLEEKKLRID
ncbi:MAG: DUF1361 domain-containing protein [Bacteroidota bacterium]